ncbi:hypothetical protein B0H13DRAFT_1852041 [Mycena leptocephala]|nr:hypothetical protein B0H13DRAFT_1852041 [Mycena leptocephala]
MAHLYHTQSIPNADRKSFTVVVYSGIAADCSRPVSSFQANSTVTAQVWMPQTATTISGYLGFRSGAIESITLARLEFDSDPTRVVLVQPSGDMITNLAYRNNMILFITSSHLVTFRKLGLDSVTQTLPLTELLKIWAHNPSQRSHVQEPLHSRDQAHQSRLVRSNEDDPQPRPKAKTMQRSGKSATELSKCIEGGIWGRLRIGG